MPWVDCEVCNKKIYRSPGELKKQKHITCSPQCSGIARQRRIEMNCEYCGKGMQLRPCEIEHAEHHYCCRDCADKALITSVDITCHYCGKPLKRQPCRVAKSKHQYCNRACEAAARIGRSRPPTGKKVVVKCAWCGQPSEKYLFEVEKNNNCFCCSECYYKWRKVNWVGEAHHAYKKEPVECDNCGEIIYRTPNRAAMFQYHFCSISCRIEFLRGEHASLWRGGNPNTDYASNWNIALKEQVRDRDNRQCQLCFRYEAEFPEKLSVHHLDGNKENSHEDNLLALCRRCHLRIENNQYKLSMLKENADYRFIVVME